MHFLFKPLLLAQVVVEGVAAAATSLPDGKLQDLVAHRNAERAEEQECAQTTEYSEWAPSTASSSARTPVPPWRAQAAVPASGTPAETSTPSTCLGTGPQLPQLAELGHTWVPPEARNALAKKHPDGFVSGTKELKESQKYPRAFRQSIGLLYSRWRSAPNHVTQELATDEQPMDMWEDAELEGLASLCGVPMNRYPWE